YHELMGCHVYNEQGEDTGEVVAILETGANLVLRVQDKEKQYLLPFVEAFVLDVDVVNKTITIKEQEGLR
ncbi:MAG: ribosome maturation factor RimM, partial [Allobaculum sp.]|nr:ribosome maturation factor RimM [Allobaculum sp.]